MSSVSLPGRYLDRSGVERDCMLRGKTPETLEVMAYDALAPDERIVCRVPGLGLLTGRAAQQANGAFRLELEVGPTQRDRLAARLGWHAGQATGASDRREAVVIWDGAEAYGLLRDVSANGVAIDLMPRPGIGTAITIGRRRGHVVRHTETGIGVRFVLPLSPYDVTEGIVL